MKHILLFLALLAISPAYAQEAAQSDTDKAAQEIARAKTQKVEAEFARCLAHKSEDECNLFLLVLRQYEQDALGLIREHAKDNIGQANIDMLACYQTLYYSEYVNCMDRVARPYKSAAQSARKANQPPAMDKPVGYDSLMKGGE